MCTVQSFKNQDTSPRPSDIMTGLQQRSVVRHHGGTREQSADGAEFSGQTDHKTLKAPAHNFCVDQAALASRSLAGPV